jgi:hypothetical protein
VGSSEIADLAVATAELANQAVTTGKLADNAVTSAKLATDSVTNLKMADDAVGSAEVADGSLRAADIGVLSGTVSIDPPNLRRPSAGSAMCNYAWATVNGIQPGDQLILNPPPDLEPGIIGYGFVQTVADILVIRVCNTSNVDNLNDVARDWAYIVVRP